ncbi:MAG: efflux RND transporter periplasmic adaptor subunit [Phycisphaerales bacterium]|nr:efflux RND transporter periplasmic adaptor subunit [Phycisphaerales bacterium]
MKKLLLLVILAGMLVGTGTMYWRRSNTPDVILSTKTVSRGDMVVSISATGTIQPEEVIDVGAQVGGLILWFGKDANGNPVDYCSPVEAGTVLARIDDALYTSEATQAEAQVLSAQGGLQRALADLEQAKAKLYLAERNWQRAQKLGSSSSALAATDYDNYKANHDSAMASVSICEAAIVEARGNLAQAEGMLDRARRNLGYTTITSPVKGIIIDRRVNIGQTVIASMNAPSLFLIAKDLTRIQVWVAVNETDVGRLHPGQPVTFTVSTFPDEMFKGQVGKIRLNASMTQNVVTYTVEVVADNPDGRLLPYLTADVKFELERYDNVLMVPNEALEWTPTLAQVAPEWRKALEDPTATASSDRNTDPAASRPNERLSDHEDFGVLWTPEGPFVRPIYVRIGATDDFATEVRGEELAEDLPIVTGQIERSTAEQSPAGSNPFLPKPPSGRRMGPPPM